MKTLFLITSILLTLISNAQQANTANSKLSVSPIINQSDIVNKKITETLSAFLASKNFSLTENNYWVKEDFTKYVYPYLDIYNIESSKYGADFYKPTLMEIIPTENAKVKILKIAFIGHSKDAEENQLKAIYNIIANVQGDEIKFSRYLPYATQNWQTIDAGSITYKISPKKTANESEIKAQQVAIKNICSFFNCQPLPLTYYSCLNPKEIFEIKGFDYHPMMYADKSGGLADFGNIIFSGNNAEIYTHEIIHIYTNNLFPEINKFIDEGLATFLAGSGKFDYEWHRKKLARFLAENPTYDFIMHTDPFERIYFEEETSIPYLTAALILERTMRLSGKIKLLEILNADTDLWTILKSVGLTKENINVELRKEIKLEFRNQPIL